MRRTDPRKIGLVVLLATVVVAAAWFGFFSTGQPGTRPPAEPRPSGSGLPSQTRAPDDAALVESRQAPDPPPPTPAGLGLIWPKFKAMPKAEAIKAFKSGLAMVVKADGTLAETEWRDYVPARRLLSKAHNSGALGPARAAQAARALAQLARVTIFSSRVYPGDDLVTYYQFKSGDWLAGLRNGRPGVIRRFSFRVPSQIILKINGLASGTGFRAGRRYKMIRGPFHAIVRKSLFVMDLYLKDTFVKRYRVGLGAPRTPTPTGWFHLVLGGKTTGSTYYPPGGRGPVMALVPGDKDYPLDPGGHNIKIEGAPAKGTDIPASASYAIHGTNSPSSIGKAEGLGCIRLGRADIEEVYTLLYEKWSTVRIVP